MYQQALTFIEALMPDDFVRAKIIWFDTNQVSKIQRCKTYSRKWYLSDAHYAFEKDAETSMQKLHDKYIKVLDALYADKEDEIMSV